ncbi:phage major capsid protein [Oscillospiraceae bacterium OttesenSCG-928-F05]|nr:phage major capsid protein [Oscillospiraceae bacterium OttesenSCG-928-F05]
MSYAYDTLKLEKGMYRQSDKSFSQILESLDPSEGYKGTSIDGLDAFQRQLKRFGIRVKGAQSDRVERFFMSSETAVLFPEFVARAVRQGMEEKNILPAITAAITRFDGLDYRTIRTASAPSDAVTAEGAALPEIGIRTDDNLVALKKRGQLLTASYESIRYQRLDLFSVALRQIGSHIMQMHLKDAVAALDDADITAYAVGDSTIGGTAGSLSYDEVLAFWAEFNPYELNTILASNDVVLELLKLSQFQNPEAGLDFQGTGKLVTPLGATLIPSAALAKGTMIGMDRRYALEMVTASELDIESDKLIDRQLERAAIVSVAGFAKIFPDASKKLELE